MRRNRGIGRRACRNGDETRDRSRAVELGASRLVPVNLCDATELPAPGWFSRARHAPRGAFSRCESGGLFLAVLCTIRPLSEESLALPSGGANAFWGLLTVGREQLERAASAFFAPEPDLALWELAWTLPPDVSRAVGRSLAGIPPRGTWFFRSVNCNRRNRFPTEQPITSPGDKMLKLTRLAVSAAVLLVAAASAVLPHIAQAQAQPASPAAPSPAAPAPQRPPRRQRRRLPRHRPRQRRRPREPGRWSWSTTPTASKRCGRAATSSPRSRSASS